MEQMEQSGPGAGGQEFELVTEEEIAVEGGKDVGPGLGDGGGEPVVAEGSRGGASPGDGLEGGPGEDLGEDLAEDLAEDLLEVVDEGVALLRWRAGPRAEGGDGGPEKPGAGLGAPERSWW